MREPVSLRSIDDDGGIRDTSSQDVAREQPKGRRWLLGAAAITVLAAIVLLVWIALPWFSTERSVNREQLRFATVFRGPFLRDVSAQGIVVAAVAPTLFAGSAGTVTLRVRAGDTVASGDVIAVIDSPELRNERDREQASLASLSTNLDRQSIDNRKQRLALQQTVDLARVELTAAERELRRAESSWEYRVISRQDYEKAIDDVDKARIGLEHAEKAAALDAESLDFELQTLRLERNRQQLVVDDSERRLAALTLRAPVDGIVGDLAVDDRAYVDANAPIASVVDLSELEIELSIADSYADELVIGSDVVVRIDNADVAGQLTSISPEVVNATVTARVRFNEDQPVGLRRNQRVTARVILERRGDALLVERGPFYDTGGGRMVYRVEGDTALRTAIESGASSVRYVEILNGLNEGDVIVISEINRFRDAERALLRD
ncbi:MAG: HlyD family efflux transporter periplasmic adaptor subunit [Pseudomonadota bacterium]